MVHLTMDFMNTEALNLVARGWEIKHPQRLEVVGVGYNIRALLKAAGLQRQLPE